MSLDSHPLLEPGSFKLTNEEVVGLISSMGFTIVKHEIMPVERGLNTYDSGMLQNRYRNSRSVAKKSIRRSKKGASQS